MGAATLLGFPPHLRYCPLESPDLPFGVSVLSGSPEVLSSLGVFSPKIPCPCLGFLLLMGFQLVFVLSSICSLDFYVLTFTFSDLKNKCSENKPISILYFISNLDDI